MNSVGGLPARGVQRPRPQRGAIVARVPTRSLALCLVVIGVAAALLGRPDLGGGLPGAAARATRVEGRNYPKTLIGPTGRARRLEAAPRRIVSATLASDEILARLVGFERLAGITELVDDPDLSLAAGTIPAAIPRVEARIEELLPLSPDLVVVANYTRAETVQLIDAAGIPLLRLGAFRSFEDVFANLRRLARAADSEADAEAWIGALRERIRRVEHRVVGRPRPRVLYLAGPNYTAGEGSLVDEVLTRAGARNCAREAGLRESSPISTELAIALQPELILVTGWSGARGETTASALRDDPRWHSVPAVADGRIHVVPSAMMLSVTHHAVDALEHVAEILLDATPTPSEESG